MSFCKTIAALAALAALGNAQANVVTTVSGDTTTYTENFNGGTQFSAGWNDYNTNGDDYLWVNGSIVANWSFTAAEPLSSVTVSFWYSVPDALTGVFGFGSQSAVLLPDTPGTAVNFNENNPGPDVGGVVDEGDYDALYTATFTNLAAGTYTISFSSATDYTYGLGGLKVDDLTVTAITAAVPEPETYALLLAGLGAVGFVARRSSTRRD